jgi:hypothetical protein
MAQGLSSSWAMQSLGTFVRHGEPTLWLKPANALRFRPSDNFTLQLVHAGGFGQIAYARQNFKSTI